MSVDPAAFPIRLQSILMKEDINVYTFVYRRMQEVKTLRNKSKIYHILADDPIKYIYIFFLPRVPVIWQSSQLSATIILHLGPLSYDFVSWCGLINYFYYYRLFLDIRMLVHRNDNSKLQPTRCNVTCFIYFYRRCISFRRFLRPSSGAHKCTHSFRYCQPILLLAAIVDL